jgi:hypothetical protein
LTLHFQQTPFNELGKMTTRRLGTDVRCQSQFACRQRAPIQQVEQHRRPRRLAEKISGGRERIVHVTSIRFSAPGHFGRRRNISGRGGGPMVGRRVSIYTLFLRYTIDPNKLAAWRAYAEAEFAPITESGGKITGYYAPTEFAGATSEAFATIDVGTMAEYEVYRAKLAEHPKHKENVAKIEASGAIHSIYLAVIKRVEPPKGNKLRIRIKRHSHVSRGMASALKGAPCHPFRKGSELPGADRWME